MQVSQAHSVRQYLIQLQAEIFNKESLHQKNKGKPMVHLHSMAVQKSQLLVCGYTMATPCNVGKP